jgi:hypothetical protein
MYIAGRFIPVEMPMKLWIALALAPLAFACSSSVESTDIRTTGIYPEIEVTATGNGSSKVEVWLKVGDRNSNTYLDLKGEDTLEVTVGDETKTLDQSGDSYRASFGVDAEGTTFEIAFLRGDEDDDAPSSIVSLPAPFDLSLDVTTASRMSDDVSFTWEPPADGSIDWEIEGSCIQSADDDTPDDGSASLAAGSIETFTSDADKSCTVDLTLTRSRSGTIDPAFTEGGRIVARHVREDTFTSTP